MSAQQARTELSIHSEDYVSAVLDYVEKRLQQGKVKDVPGYTVMALQRGYMEKETKFSRSEREKKIREIRERELQTRLTDLREEFQAFRKERVSQVLGSSTEEEKRSLRDDFIRSMAPHEVQILKKSGFGSPLIVSRFTAYIASKFLLRPDERDFDAFIRSKGISDTVVEMSSN